MLAVFSLINVAITVPNQMVSFLRYCIPFFIPLITNLVRKILLIRLILLVIIEYIYITADKGIEFLKNEIKRKHKMI